MNEFFFDLQRFADYTIIAGGSATITGTGTKTFSVTVGTNPPTNYSIDLVDNATTVIVSTDANGTIKLNVTSGSVNNIQKSPATDSFIPFVLLGGTVLMNAQAITFGEKGPTIANLHSGDSDKRVSITLTENGDFNEVNITSNNFQRVYELKIGGLSYTPPKVNNPSPFFLKINKETGRTYIEVDKYIGSVKYNDSSTYTIKYNDGTGEKAFTPKSGTVTFAIDKDGNNFAVTGLEVGDSFQLGDVVYTMTEHNFKAVSYDTGVAKALNGNALPSSTDEILLKDLNFDSGNMSEMNLIDGIDYCTYLNPGLVGLLTDNSKATQYTDAASSTTGVEIGVGALVNDNPPVVMSMPTRVSGGTVTRMLIDIAPTSSATLKVFFPFNSSNFNFLLTLSSTGTLQVDSYNGSTLLDTMTAIKLTDCGVDLSKPIRLALQTTFINNVFVKPWVSIEVGTYVYNKYLGNVSVPFSATNKSLKFVSDTSDVVKISNIIVRDEGVGQLLEQIVPLAVSATDTDMTESNGLYTATEAGQTLLQTPDISKLLTTFKRTDTVKNILVVGNPAYKKNGALNRLTCIDKTGGTVTTHNSVALGTSTIKAISDNWGVKNITLNDLTDMQFGWKAEA